MSIGLGLPFDSVVLEAKPTCLDMCDSRKSLLPWANTDNGENNPICDATTAS